MFKYLKPYWLQTVILVAAIGLQAWGTLQLPTMMSVIVNEGIVAENSELIARQGMMMVGVALLAGAAALISGFLSARVGAAVGRDIREDFFRQVLSFSIREIDDFSTASLITRTTNDISIVQNTMMQVLSMMLRAPLMAVGAIAQAVALAPDMTWIIALAVSVMAVSTTVVLGIVMPKFKIYQKLQDRINLETRESLTGLRVIRAFNNERLEEKKFSRTNEEMRRVDVFANTLMALESPLMTLVFDGATLLCIWIGVMHMQTDASYLGKMMAFMQYATQTILSFMFLIVLIVMIPRANVSANRINEVMRRRAAIRWKKHNEGVEEGVSVEFKKASFSYGQHAEEMVLSDISFRAEAGKTTAIIGSTGSGKTTLVNLLLRFYDATSGEILVNGRNVKDYDEKTLISKIGYVPQKAFLFSGTVESNILFGVDESGLNKDERRVRVRKAAEVAQAKEFIEKLPEKYAAPISEGGTNVSGGQKQRISIARAIAKQPQIYVFDDAFSALDMKTDQRLREALAEVTREAVTIIVAQRISTIKNADQILVLDNGRLVGKGTHRELLHECKVYQEIAKSQFSDAEFEAEMKKK